MTNFFQIFGLSDQELRSRITKYIVNETEAIEQKLDSLLKLTTGKHVHLMECKYGGCNRKDI